MPIELTPARTVSEGAKDVVAVDVTDWLDSGETVASGTVAEQTTTDITLGAVVVNAAAVIIDGHSVAIGHGVSFTIRGQKTTGSPYKVRLTVVTSAGREYPWDIPIEVV